MKTIFTPKFYSLNIEKISNENNLELISSGILVKSYKKNSMNFDIDFINPRISSYMEITIGNNNAKEILIGTKLNGVDILENNNKKYSIINKILKNKENIYLYLYDDDNKNNIVSIYKINIK